MSNTLRTPVDLKKYKETLESFTNEFDSDSKKFDELCNMNCGIINSKGEAVTDEEEIQKVLAAARKGTGIVYFSPGPGMPLAKYSGFLVDQIDPQDLAADTLGTDNATVKDLADRAAIEDAHRNSMPEQPSAGIRFLSGLLRVVTLGIFGGFDSVKKYDKAMEELKSVEMPEEDHEMPARLKGRQETVKATLRTINANHRENARNLGDQEIPYEMLADSKTRQAINQLTDLNTAYQHLQQSLADDDRMFAYGSEALNVIREEMMNAKKNKEVLPEEDEKMLHTISEMNPLVLRAFCNKIWQDNDPRLPLSMDNIRTAVNDLSTIIERQTNYRQYKAVEEHQKEMDRKKQMKAPTNGMQRSTP